jgi:hypothetical protein
MAKKKSGVGGELVVLENHQPVMPTREDLVMTLESHRSRALADGAYSAANAAVALQAKLLGMIVDKHQVERIGDFSEARTVEEVIQQVEYDYGPEAAKVVTGYHKRIALKR